MLNPKMLETNPFDTTGLPDLAGPDTYETWCEALQAHLQLTGLWGVVSGDNVKPSSPPLQTLPGVKTTPRSIQLQLRPSTPFRNDRDTQGILKTEIQSPENKAKTVILKTLSREIRLEAMGLQSPKEIWDFLDRKYYQVHPLDGLQAAKNIFYDDCCSVQNYALRMMRALDKIDRSIGPTACVPEPMKVQYLLCNLGHTWTAFLASFWVKNDIRNVSFEKVVEELIQEEMARRAGQRV
ncbi:hypothetical protein BO78DRAFT_390683 [Aspergillus sclerotiicarbonarius CBS 121057]|uniref:DUF4219 domain-containing protein n=1 Tax=Aspergillus sclerotiicarbonarius (strain CBS 121057 / IBT 28362) TaxID=1448318 RepID=A0A319EME2_ASPSB|nr:hypothetical protein BO78DRAFT_390683 [Aspergillus sclerotiicarbonarius CBS 121057]